MSSLVANDGHLSNGQIQHISEQKTVAGSNHVEATIDSNNDFASNDDEGNAIDLTELVKNDEILSNSLEIDSKAVKESFDVAGTVDKRSSDTQYVDKSTNDIRFVDAEGWEDLLGSGRLRKRVLVEGDPSNHPAKGSQVKIHFKGTFEGQVFEESELEFCVQEHEVISALNLVLPLMNIGEKCEIIADHDFAYGKVGYPPLLPPNAAIHATVTLLECRPALITTELPIDERKMIGQRKKDRGNFWYSRQNYSDAVQCYRRAVEYFDDEKLELEAPIDRFSLDPILQDLLQDRLKTFNNLAQAQMKLESWEAALASIKNVLKIEPNNEKALYRKSKCLEERGQIDEAMGILRRITRIYPENKTACSDLARLMDRRKKNRLVEERMSKRMLGLEDDKKTSNKKADKNKDAYLSNKQWIALGLMMGGTGVLLGGIMSYFSRSQIGSI